MANPIEHYLTEFHLDPARDIAPLSRLQPPSQEEEREVVDMAAMLRAAEERGREEGRARAKRDFDAALAAERAQHQESIVRERAKWADEEAARLASGMDEAFRSIDKALTDGVARILAPFLADALRDQALHELTATLAAVLADRRAATIRIAGPEDLISLLSERLSAVSASVEYVVSDQADVSVMLDDTLIETQLSAWTARLAGALRMK
jgi:hypothetical protein